MRSYWTNVGSWSSMTGVFIRRRKCRHRDTWGKVMWKQKQRLEWGICKPGTARGSQPPPEASREAQKQSLLQNSSSTRNQACWFRTSGLQREWISVIKPHSLWDFFRAALGNEYKCVWNLEACLSRFQLVSTRCINHHFCFLTNPSKRDFPGTPMVMNLPPNAGVVGSIPGWETKIPGATGQLSRYTATR